MTPRVPRLTCLLIAGAIAAPAAQQLGPGSVERVRAALDKPPAVPTLTVRKPDFTVEIHERRPLQEVFDPPPWALPHVEWRPPAVGFDLLSVARYVAKSVAAAKRAHDAHLAHDEVQLAITDYCAAQPDAGAAIQICSTSPAIR